MSVQEVTYYQAVCDLCGNVDNEGDFSAWADCQSALDAAGNSEWWICDEDDGILCQSCADKEYAEHGRYPSRLPSRAALEGKP